MRVCVCVCVGVYICMCLAICDVSYALVVNLCALSDHLQMCMRLALPRLGESVLLARPIAHVFVLEFVHISTYVHAY